MDRIQQSQSLDNNKIQGITELALRPSELWRMMSFSLQSPINIVKGGTSGTTKCTHEQHQETSVPVAFGGCRGTTRFDSTVQTKPSSLPHLQKALDQGMIVAPRRLQTSTATRVRRLGWNEQESKQNGASCYCWKLFHNITTLHPWDEGAVCCDEYSQDYHKPWDEQYPKCNSHWWQCGFKNDQQDHSRLEHYDLIRLMSNPGMNLTRGWAWQRANHNGRQACKPSSNNIRGTSCMYTTKQSKIDMHWCSYFSIIDCLCYLYMW
jgi:hypothetical protein